MLDIQSVTDLTFQVIYKIGGDGISEVQLYGDSPTNTFPLNFKNNAHI